ncbi:MAG: LptF/LptG family permease, partial [Candidatus Marinimicrobia bacterium]|nr:LptF/LptG family permease [Candidatus Neomarinimicrobiota bacterium]
YPAVKFAPMLVFRRYIIKEHVGPFIFALLVLLFVLLTNFLLRAIDRFLGKGLGFGVLLEYLTMNLAWIVALAAPMAVLVATLMAFGRLSHDNEITALRTAGLSYRTIMLPAIIFGTVVCLLLIYFNDQILPDANHKARLLSSDIKRKRPDLGIQVGYFVDDLPSYGMIVKGRQGEKFSDILIYSKDNSANQVTIFADRGTMQTIDDAVLLHLEDGEIHELSLPGYEEYRRLKFERHRIVIPVDNLYLERRESKQRGDREMNIAMMQGKIAGYEDKIQLVKRRVANRIKSQTSFTVVSDTGQAAVMALVKKWQQVIADSSGLSLRDSTRLTRRAGNLERGLVGDFNLIHSYHKGINRYLVEIHKKFSIPFACIVFILVGAPVGIMARRGGFVVATSLSLGFFVIYWALLIAGEELADRGLVLPSVAMWGGNMLLTLIGAFLLWHVQSEMRVWRLDILDFFRKKNKTEDNDSALQEF